MPAEPTNSHAAKRLDHAEEEILRLREDIRRLHEKLDAIIASISILREQHSVDGVRLNLDMNAIKGSMCPAPGTCMILRSEVSALKDEFSKWNNAKQQALGGAKVVKTLWTGVGALATVVFYIIAEYFRKE